MVGACQTPTRRPNEHHRYTAWTRTLGLRGLPRRAPPVGGQKIKASAAPTLENSPPKRPRADLEVTRGPGVASAVKIERFISGSWLAQAFSFGQECLRRLVWIPLAISWVSLSKSSGLQSVTGLAPTPPCGGLAIIQGMPSWAVSLPSVDTRKGIPAHQISSKSHQIKVIRIHTSSVAAQMIDSQPLRYLAPPGFPRISVSVPTPAIVEEFGIASGVE